MGKYTKHNKEYIKLTIRCDLDDLNRFKKVCSVLGLSANNQINLLIRKFNFENKNLTSDESYQNMFGFEQIN